jgi:RNA exonuclease 4
VDKPIQIAEFTERQKKPGRYIAIDAEFVGIGDGRRSGLARVSIVNYYGYTLLDTYVRPKERVRDWRTWVSGIRPSHMRNAVTLEEAQAKVADLIKNRIVVGHAIRNDFSALKLSHPHSSVRDTSSLPAFRALSNGQSPGLKRLSREILKIDIQKGQHSSVEDAQATMLLFRLYKHEFEVLTLGKKARAPLPNDI